MDFLATNSSTTPSAHRHCVPYSGRRIRHHSGPQFGSIRKQTCQSHCEPQQSKTAWMRSSERTANIGFSREP
jgi:hypothetical protein